MRDPLDLLFPDLPLSARVAVTGSGGKSSLIFSLARSLHSRGYQAIIACTTHMWNPQRVTPALPGFRLEFTQHPSSLCLPPGSTPLFLSPGLSRDGEKIQGYSPSVLDFPLPPRTFLLIEADGAARRPLKAHAPHEPVCPKADITVAVAGLSGLDQALTEAAVHRHLLAAARLCLMPGSPLQPAHVAALLSSPCGPLRNASGRLIYFLNQYTSSLHSSALAVAALLPHPCLAGSAALSQAFFLSSPHCPAGIDSLTLHR